MIRKRKIGAVAAAGLAILGVSAFIVASAGAHTPAQFEFAGGGMTLIHSKVDGNHEIDLPGYGKLVCKTVEFQTTVTGATATTLALVPSFHECKVGEQEATVKTNDCQFVFNANGGMEIASIPGGSCFLRPMEIEFNICEVVITPQSLTGVGYTNINKEQEITFTMSITKLEGIRAGCVPEGEFNSGQYTTGNTILYGEEDKIGGAKKQIRWLATVP